MGNKKPSFLAGNQHNKQCPQAQVLRRMKPKQNIARVSHIYDIQAVEVSGPVELNCGGNKKGPGYF